jgi:hypothetical protein
MKKLAAYLVPSLLIITGAHPAIADPQGGLELNFNHKTLSASIQNARLKSVIEAIQKRKSIWFKYWLKGKSTILEEKISLQFENVPVKKGLGRIFSSINHSLVFDQRGNLLGVYLLGEPEKTKYQGRSTSTRGRSIRSYSRRR